MDDMFSENDFLSYITPDLKYPNTGIVRITNNKIKIIAKSEGFIDYALPDQTNIISDEERLVVKIMFNHLGTVLLKRNEQKNREVIVFFHEDGIVSCENETSETVVFHCFSTIDDLLAYHINDFISAEYETPEYPYHFMVPTDNTLYKESHEISYTQKLKLFVLNKLKATDLNDIERYKIEKSYIEEWDFPKYTLHLHANNCIGEIGFISFLFCKSCIWAIYPYEKNYARVKVMGSAEAQNKFCEFIHSFTDNMVITNEQK